MKQIFSIVIMFIFAITNCISVNASGNEIETPVHDNEASLLYVVGVSVESKLHFGDGIAYCTISHNNEKNINADIYISLLYSPDRKHWASIKKWNVNLKNQKLIFIQKSNNVMLTGNYMLEYNAYIYNTDGTYIENVKSNCISYYKGSGCNK